MSALGTVRAQASVLVLVDYQQRLMPALHGHEAALAEAMRLVQAARALAIPILGTEQNPAGLGPNVPALREACGRTLAKMHFDACEDGLLEAVRRAHSDASTASPASPARPDATLPDAPLDIVLAGCEAHVCLLQTALGLRRAGHAVWVVEAACASRSPRDHALAMQRLRDAGAAIVAREMVVFEWMRSCSHPRFKAVLPLLRPPPG